MLSRPSWIPRLPEPLPAALAGAGFFLCLSAFSGWGPYARLDAWLGAAPPPAAALAGRAGVRVLGGPGAPGSAARAQALAYDLAWLRSQGPSLLVLEAWLDERPGAEARAFAAALRGRLAGLPPKAAKRALQALSETAASLEAPDQLAQALAACQPLLLAFEAAPGPGSPLPHELGGQAYVVSWRGERRSLDPWHPRHLPYAEALDAAPQAGAVPAPANGQAAPLAVNLDGRWFNSLGLEAARLHLQLPLEGLRYGWDGAELESLQLGERSFALDAEGRLLPASQPAPLPELDLERLRWDKAARAQLKGRVVFFRPWPKRLGEGQAFDGQARAFSALADSSRREPIPWTTWAWGLLWLLGLLAVALAPGWAAVPLWALGPGLALLGLAQSAQPAARPLALALSAFLAGLGWRLQKRLGAHLVAERRILGRSAPAHQGSWLRRLDEERPRLLGVYAVAGPRSRLQGPAWEAWLERWGALADEGPADGLGLIFAGQDPARAAAQGLLELGLQAETAAAASAGRLDFEPARRSGQPAWRVEGGAKERAWDLYARARPGQLLLPEGDAEAFAPWGRLRSPGPQQALPADGSPPWYLLESPGRPNTGG